MMKIFIEKAIEYQIPLCIAFIDYRKPLASIDHWTVKNSQQNGRIYCRYTDLISNIIYDNAPTTIKLMEKRIY